MGKVSFLYLKSTLFICITFFALSLKAVNFTSNASGNISNTLLWSDSLGNHPAGFVNPYDIFAIQNGHSMQGKWICHSTVILRVEGIWNDASGNIGNILITQGGSISQSDELNIFGNWTQNGNYIALCDSCSVAFTGNNDHFINSDAGTEISFRLIKVNLNSGYNLHVKTNLIVTHDLVFNSASSIIVYPGYSIKVNGIITYLYTSDAFSLLADSTGYGSLLYDNGTIKAVVRSFVRGGKIGTKPAINHYVSCSVKNQTGSQLIDNSLGNYNVYFLDSVGIDSVNWIRLYSNDPLIPGKGYYVAYNGNKQIIYEGLLVNDSVKDVLHDSKNWSIVGNPYPCSIDVKAFLTEKQNLANLTGVVYFYNQSENNNNDDYILLNLSGQLSKVKGSYPTGVIARSQGFGIQNSGNNLSQCVFSNQMKTNGTAKLYAGGEDKISRCFLGLENKNNYFNKQLLAFTDEAGIFYDKLYDAKSIDDTTKSPLSFYSLVKDNNSSFAIQGLNFSIDTTIIKLGYYSNVSGLLTLSLEKLSLFPDSLNLFLYDKDLNTTTDLKKNNKYIFNSDVGRFNNRFKILIVPGNPQSIANLYQKNSKWILKGNNLEINTQSDKLIESIIVYNGYGQMILIKERINKPFYSINLNGCSGLICVKALINGNPEEQKFIVTP